eukprot:2919209-Rhodomonas_salina.2
MPASSTWAVPKRSHRRPSTIQHVSTRMQQHLVRQYRRPSTMCDVRSRMYISPTLEQYSSIRHCVATRVACIREILLYRAASGAEGFAPVDR